MAIPETNNGPVETAEAAARDMPHVLVMPYPAQGHINPMMHLSAHLAAHGVLVTFVNTQFNQDRMLRARVNSSDDHGAQPSYGSFLDALIDLHIPGSVMGLINLHSTWAGAVKECAAVGAAYDREANCVWGCNGHLEGNISASAFRRGISLVRKKGP